MSKLRLIIAIGALFVLMGASVSRGGTYEYRLHLQDEAAFFRSVARVESQNRDYVVGDLHLRHRAYGRYQIRQPYLDDVNRVAGKDVVRTWGHLLTLRDMRDPEKARYAMRIYMAHYGKRYTRITGLLPTAAIYARIHQGGGPNGWRTPVTLSYARKVNSWYAKECYA